jgi:hypothetical protein
VNADETTAEAEPTPQPAEAEANLVGDSAVPPPGATTAEATEPAPEPEETPEAEVEREPSDTELIAQDDAARAGAPAAAAGPGAEASTQGEAGPAADGTPTQEQDGACQAAQPVAEPAADGGGGNCASGGAAAPAPAEAPADAPAPTPGTDPTAAMSQVEDMTPAEAGAALAGVGQSASASVHAQQQEITAAPPEMERPSGAPPGMARQSPAAPISPSIAPAPAPAARITADAAAPPVTSPIAAPTNAPLPSAQSPNLPGDAQLTPEDVEQVRDAVDTLPATDPALNVSVTTPALTLDGAANPAQVGQQSTSVATSIDAAHAGAKQDAAQPMGEGQVYPVVPQETLRPDARAGGDQETCGDGKAPPAARLAPNDPVAIVARERSGAQVQTAATNARGKMLSSQQKQAQDAQTERTTTQQKMDDEVVRNAELQTQQRTDIQSDVRQQRGLWNQEQTDLISGAQTDRAKVQRDKQKEIELERTTGNTNAAGHVREGNSQIATERKDAETKASSERQRARTETNSGGFFSWLSSKVTAFFNRIKRAIQAAFEAARRAIQSLVNKFQELALRAIEAARSAIVSAIQAAGDLLIAIGDRALRAFPGLRDRFHKAIRGLVDKAVSAVNKLADDLKEGLKKLLNELMSALLKFLRALECAFMAAINVVASVVQGAIDVARTIAQGFGQFVELIGDIAAGPRQWLRNLGSSVVSGIRNCLWSAFKTAVKSWFSSKVEEVLGLGGMIYRVLKRGCINMAQVSTMAWEGLKAAIPAVLISLLIEKLVAMIVPAAGAILAIVQGLMAAWGTVSRIITAFKLFFTFLKAVKGGNAGGQFANAVAAAAVVVIDFVANWLLKRLVRPARAVGGRLRSIAQRIMQRMGGAVRAVRRGAGRAARSGVQAFATVARRAGGAITRAGRSVARTVQRVTAVAQQRVQALRERFRRWREDRHKNRYQNAEKRLNTAVTAIKPQLRQFMARGIGKIRLLAQLSYWRIRYRLRALSLQQSGSNLEFSARVNPSIKFLNGVTMSHAEVSRMLRQIVLEEIQNNPYIQERVAQGEQRLSIIEHPADYAATALQGRNASSSRTQVRGSPWMMLSKMPANLIRIGKIGSVFERRGLIGSAPVESVHFSRRSLKRNEKIGSSGLIGDRNASGSYAAIAGMMADFQHQSGFTDQNMAAAMRHIVHTGNMPYAMRSLGENENRLIRNLTWLMHGTESARNTANIALAPMQMDLIESGNSNFQSALSGEFPMSMRNAPAAARWSDKELGFQPRAGQNFNERAGLDLMRREAELVAKWLEVRIMAGGQLAANDKSGIEYLIRQFIHDYYRLHAATAQASSLTGRFD